MKWDAMNRITRKNVFGVKYILIVSKEARSNLWIPVDLTYKNDFVRRIGKNAGKSHPLHIEILKACT